MTTPPASTQMTVAEAIRSLSKCIVFIGVVEGDKVRFYGTGLLTEVDGMHHVLTARHVPDASDSAPLGEGDLYFFFNNKDGSLGRVRIADYAPKLGISWVRHPDPTVDLAMIPIELPAGADVLVFPRSLFSAAEDIRLLDEVFFLSFQPGAVEENRVTPVARVGAISRLNVDGTYLIDGSAFPGNSGSPVFLRPVPARYGSHGLQLGDPLALRFVGVIGSYIPYNDVAVSLQTKEVRVVFQENTGLSLVFPVGLVRLLIESKETLAQVQKLRPPPTPPAPSSEEKGQREIPSSSG
jgi:hypothetical protein